MDKADPYQLFRSWVAQQRVSLGSVNEKIWKYYDFGPKDAIPLVCIPGASGTAEVFYRQMISLCPKGYRIVSVQYAPYDTHQGWCKGFDRFLDKIGAPKAHIFGTALGGYLAQCYAQYRPARVASLILNNTFSDTQYYHDHSPCTAMFSLMPEFMLKRIILENFPVQKLETEIANSVDFMVEQLEALTQAELASRLTLNCTLGFLRPGDVTLPPEHITIIDTLDDIALPENVREEVYKFYPEARVAHLRDGGNFPYISRADEVNMHLQVHLRKHGLPKLPDSEQSDCKTLEHVVSNLQETEGMLSESEKSSSHVH
jgi:maspardin